jgi:hypothetical protein
MYEDITGRHRAGTSQQSHRRAGRVSVAGMTKDVEFAPVEGPINDRIDDAYRAKYAKSRYLNPMISARARAATIKVTPLNS